MNTSGTHPQSPPACPDDDVPVLPAHVMLTEVVMRDGLQIEPRILPTDTKVALLDRISELGFPRIEVTSFVSAKAVPALADAEEVFARIRRRPGVRYTALAMTPRGAARALAAGVDEISVVVSASEAHNRANVGRDIAESFAGFAEIAAVLGERASGEHPVGLSGAISMSFGCPLEGEIPASRVFDLIERYLAMGVYDIGLADTTGMGYPTQVAALCRAARRRYPEARFGLHLHDTRGLGLANALAGLQAGIDRLDACIGGLGGCPFAPGASGNVSTEDLLHMLDAMGVSTGVDLDGVLGLRTQLAEAVGHALEGHVGVAGPRRRPAACDAVAQAPGRV